MTGRTAAATMRTMGKGTPSPGGGGCWRAWIALALAAWLLAAGRPWCDPAHALLPHADGAAGAEIACDVGSGGEWIPPFTGNDHDTGPGTLPALPVAAVPWRLAAAGLVLAPLLLRPLARRRRPLYLLLHRLRIPPDASS